jgi:hypothetical protein
MKFWKLAFLALTSVFTLQTAGCVISSDDDDDDGDSGTGGASGNAGTGGVSGNAGTGGVSGTAGTGGVSGTAGTGGVGGTGGTGGSTSNITDFFGDGDCQVCLDSMTGTASTDAGVDCGQVVDDCGVGGTTCREFADCLGEEQTEFDGNPGPDANDSLTCAMVSCGPQILSHTNGEQENSFFICLVDKCANRCGIASPLPQENDVGIDNRCPNVAQLGQTRGGAPLCRPSTESAIGRIAAGSSPREPPLSYRFELGALQAPTFRNA